MSELEQAIIESQRVEARLMALGYDQLAIYQVQQEIADLYQMTPLSWPEATDQILSRVAAGRAGGTDG